MRHLITATALLAAFAAPLNGQGRGMAAGRAGMPGCAGGVASCQYDTTTVVTLSGNVVSVDTVGSGRMGVRLQLRSAKETIPVHLGPSWVLERDGMRFTPGDRIEIVGSRVQFGGAPALIAREVRKAGKTVTLRNRAGMPLWGGPRAGRGGV